MPNQFIIISINIVFLVIGWCVVHILSSRRERKKEWRELARKQVDFIDKIIDESVRYHTNKKRDVLLEKKIKQDLEILDKFFDLLSKNIKINRTISFFRNAITLNNFESSGFVPQDIEGNLIQSIYYHASLLQEDLYSAE